MPRRGRRSNSTRCHSKISNPSSFSSGTATVSTKNPQLQKSTQKVIMTSQPPTPEDIEMTVSHDFVLMQHDLYSGELKVVGWLNGRDNAKRWVSTHAQQLYKTETTAGKVCRTERVSELVAKVIELGWVRNGDMYRLWAEPIHWVDINKYEDDTKAKENDDGADSKSQEKGKEADE